MRRKLAIVLGVFVALVIILSVLAHLFFPGERIREFVVREASGALGVAVTLGDVSPSFFPAGVTFHGLEVANPAGKDFPPLARLEEGKVIVRLFPLLHRRVEVKEADLRGLAVVLVRDPQHQGGFLLPPGLAAPAATGAGVPRERTLLASTGAPGGAPVAAAAAASSAPPAQDGAPAARALPFAVLLSAADLEDASIHVLDTTAGTEQSVDKLSATSSLRVDEGGHRVSARGELKLRDISAPELVAAGFADGLPSLDVGFDVTYLGAEGSAEVRSLTLHTGDLHLALAGEVQGLPDHPDADLRLSAPDLELGDLFSLLPPTIRERTEGFTGHGSLTLEGTARIAPPAPPTYHMTLHLAGVNVRYAELAEGIENLEGTIAASEKGTAIDTLSARVGGQPIAVSGSVTDYQNPDVDLALRGEVDLAACRRAKLLPENVDATGTIRFDVGGQGRVKDPARMEFRGVVEAKDVRALVAEPPLSVTDLQGTVRLAGQKATIEGLSLVLNDQPIRASGLLTDPIGRRTFDLRVQTDRLDLSAMSPLVKTPPGVLLTGRVTADVRLQGSGQAPDSAVATGTVRLVEGRAELPELAVPLTDLEGTVELTPDLAKATNLRATAGRSHLTADARVENPYGAKYATVNARAPFLDLDELLPPPPAGDSAATAAAPAGVPAGAPPVPLIPPIPDVNLHVLFQGDTLVSAGHRMTGVATDLRLTDTGGAGTLRMETGTFEGVRIRNARYDLTLAGDSMTGTLTADSTVSYGVPLTDARGTATVRSDGTITIDGMTARVYSGRVSGNAVVQVKSAQDVDYTFDVKGENLEANDFLSDLTPARNILYGSMEMTSHWTGSGVTPEAFLRSLTAKGSAMTASGHLQNLPALDELAGFLGLKELKQIDFSTLRTAFVVENGRLRTRDLSLKGNDAVLAADGSIGFDGTLDYTFDLQLSDALTQRYRKQTKLTNLFVGPDDRVVFDFTLGGTAAKPALRYDASKTASRSGVKSLGSLLDEIDKDGKARDLLEGILGKGKKDEKKDGK